MTIFISLVTIIAIVFIWGFVFKLLIKLTIPPFVKAVNELVGALFPE